MKPMLLPSGPARRVLAAVALAAAIAPSASFAQASGPTRAEGTSDSALAACERAARQTLSAQAPVEVALGPPSIEPGLSNDGQSVLRGNGRSRGAGGARTFSYLCNVDLKTNEAVGLVLRDLTTTAAAPAPRPAPKEPDLSQLSPASCESSAAEALRRRWPRVSKITFDSSTRRFSQPNADVAELHGSGLALPGPGAPNTVFQFDCAIDPHDGRVLRTRITG